MDRRDHSRRADVRLLNPGAGAGTRTQQDLHVCPQCSSELVQPIDWAPVDMRRWRVELRCPECAWRHAGTFPQHVLDRFDAMLDDGAASLMEDLSRLQKSNMEQEIANFSLALRTDQILPEDF